MWDVGHLHYDELTAFAGVSWSPERRREREDEEALGSTFSLSCQCSRAVDGAIALLDITSNWTQLENTIAQNAFITPPAPLHSAQFDPGVTRRTGVTFPPPRHQ